MVDSLSYLGWVQSYEIDSTTSYLASDTYGWNIVHPGGQAVHAYERGAGVKIAYMDGGTWCNVADIAGRVVGGYDFVNSTATYCQDNLNSTVVLDHGTSVAQVLGAGLNGVNFVGMAPEAALYNLRACDANNICGSPRVVSALNWALTNGMDVVSGSLVVCGTPSSSLLAAINALYQAGVVQVYAGGNGNAACNGGVSALLSAPGTIGVTGYVNGTYAYVPGFSHHSYLDLAAPTDVPIISIFGGPACCFGGTSASTPHVAGAAALLRGLGFTGVDLITQRLTSTANDAGATGYDIFYGYGRLNVSAAAVLPPYVSQITGAPQPITSPGTFTLTATLANGAPPFGVRWQIHYSNAVLPDVTTGFGAATYALEAPAGDYFIDVIATPKELTYLRVGGPNQVQYAVCTTGGGGGGGNSIRVVKSVGRRESGARPEVITGC